MKSLTTLEIVIIIIVLIVGLLFVLGWLGVIPLDWPKKMAISSNFCSEIEIRIRCKAEKRSWNDVQNEISETDYSTTIKCRDIGYNNNWESCKPGTPGDTPAAYKDICLYLGNYRNLKECLEKVCGCNFY